jgi:hypothetical protein
LPTELGDTASPTARTALVPAPIGETASATARLAPTPLGDTASPAAELALQPISETVTPPVMVTLQQRLEEVAREGELNPCLAKRRPDEAMVDTAQRKLFELLCGASLWFDGLFGERRNLSAAQGASGRVEISYLNSEYDGSKFRLRGSIRVDFPNLEKRVHAFLGRDDEDEFIQDRTEGLALRSQFIPVETDEKWLAGLGYGLPGSYKQRSDFRVGGKLGSEPEIFLQGRHRRNWVPGINDIWHFRETVFWTNREGFGSTTSLDWDHIFRRHLLLRWASIGTYSEETEGFEWRSAMLFYQDLEGDRAIAYETFLRGWTEGEVPIREYGARAIYRQTIFNRPWLWTEVVLGYSWPREYLIEDRDGSLTFGLGVEIRFDRDLVEAFGATDEPAGQ